MKKVLKSLFFTVFVLAALACTVFVSSAAEDGKWIGAWSTAPTKIGIAGYENITAAVKEVTTRTVLTCTASGSKIRVRFSNIHGEKPITLDSVTVAKSVSGSTIDETTLRYITFNNGSPSVTIPAGEYVYSDAISFNVTAMENIAISIYVNKLNEITTMGLSGAESYLARDNQTGSRNLMFSSDFDIDNEIVISILKQLGFNMGLHMSYSFVKVTPCIEAVDVLSDEKGYSVVVIGDSTVSNEFPKYLGDEIFNTGTRDVGVLGKGIIGNRLGGDGLGYGSLIFGHSMLDRLDTDVLSQSGVKYAIIKIGANDIMHPVCKDIQEQYPGIKQPTAQELIACFKEAFEKLHKAGIKVIVIGITQWKGNDRDYLGTGAKYVRTEAEFKHDWQIALDVNKWLATTAAAQKLHDGYVSFNEISANPNDPESFLMPEYSSDGAHPSDTLQKIWAQNFPLSLIGVTKRVGNVRLDKANLSLQISNSAKLNYTILPEDAVNKNVSWSSSNTAVATVDQFGFVTAVGGGMCEIICKSEDGGYIARCPVTVTVPVSSVEVTPKTAEIYTTRTVKLSYEVFPASASNKKVRWYSGNERVATVDENGVVTGVGSGTASIICETVDGKFTSRCEVKVLQKIEVSKIELSKYKTTIRLGKSDLISASVIPADATFRDVVYKSSNTKIATVDEYGNVNAISPGTATITVTAKDNSFATARCTVNVVVDVTSIRLNRSTATIYAGKSLTLVPTVYPLNATNKKVNWISDNDNIASVDRNGTVLGKRAGTTTITCISEDGGFVATCIVTVKKIVKSTSVSLNRLSCTVYVGRTKALVATVEPEDTTDKSLIWRSSNKKVATVDSKGVVKAVGKGTATITCTTRDTGKKAVCEVTVKNVKVQSIKLSKQSAALTVKQSLQLSCLFTPADTTIKTVTWTSSNPKVAKVDSKGKVTAVAPGKATITCKTQYRNKTATCVVTVSLQKIKKVSFKSDNVEVVLGTKQTLSPVISPKGATGGKLKWKSSDPSVVKVNSKGRLTAVKAGKAIITCTPADGGNAKEAQIVVTVVKRSVLGVKLNKIYLSLKPKDTARLKATIVPQDATNKKVKWSSSNRKIAKVNSKGVVTAVGKGYCEIRVVTNDGNYIAICAVKVK